MKTRISWKEKMKKEPKIVDIPQRMIKKFGRGKMLIPSPLDIDALIRKVEEGKLITQSQIREKLAEKYGVKVTCPLTTGIFLKIVAEAAEEDIRNGKKKVTPYWRVIKDDGSLNSKFPGGVEVQAKRLREEGHIILEGKKSLQVKDFKRYLQELEN